MGCVSALCERESKRERAQERERKRESARERAQERERKRESARERAQERERKRESCSLSVSVSLSDMCVMLV